MILLTPAKECGLEETYPGEWVAKSDNDEELEWMDNHLELMEMILFNLSVPKQYQYN